MLRPEEIEEVLDLLRTGEASDGGCIDDQTAFTRFSKIHGRRHWPAVPNRWAAQLACMYQRERKALGPRGYLIVSLLARCAASRLFHGDCV